MVFLKGLLLGLLLVRSVVNAAPAVKRTKSVVLKDFSAFDASDDRKPPYRTITFSQWASGSYPQFCYDTARSQRASDDTRPNCATNQIQVFTFTFDDCKQYPWTVCRCADAQLTTEQMAKAFGRVPPGVRSHVIHIFVLSGQRPDGSVFKSGGSNNDRFVIKGPIDDAAFTHESMHSVDKGFSSSSTFTNAYNADTCVPDDYSNSNNAEDFAQLGVWLDYDQNGQPVKNYIGKDYSCLNNQLAAVDGYAHKYINLQQSQCFARAPNDPNVSAQQSVEEILPPIKWEFEDVWE